MIVPGVIKCSPGKQDFLSPELMPHNYKRLDRRYEKLMGPDDLDERIFFRDRSTNLTPSKFTPFARQGYANKGRGLRAGDKEGFSSHRILNYDLGEAKVSGNGIGGIN
ncbi:unnamed protein product [Sphagnum balticum]